MYFLIPTRKNKYTPVVFPCMAKETRGRPSKVTASEILDLLDYVDEPLSTADLAERFDVSRNTIRSRFDDLETLSHVGSKPVAGSKVFWYRTDDERDLDVLEEIADLDDFVTKYQEYARDELVSSRAVYLDKRERIRTISRVAAADTETGIHHRLKLLSAVHDYESTLAASGLFAYDQIQMARTSESGEIQVDLEAVYDEDEYHLDRKEFEYYALNVSLFGGDVEGLTALPGVYHRTMSVVRDNFDGAEFDYKAVKDVVPEFEEIVQAGDILDDFVCGVYEVDW